MPKLKHVSYEQQGNKHIPPPNKIDEPISKTGGTGKSRVPPEYSTGQDKTRPGTTNDNQISSQKKNCKVRVLPRGSDDERALRLSKNGIDLFPPSKRHLDDLKLPKRSYAEIFMFKEIDKITLFKKKIYKIPMQSGLTVSHMHHTNCLFAIDTGPGALQKELVEPEWLPLTRLCESPRRKNTTNWKVEVIAAVVLHVYIWKILRRGMFGVFWIWTIWSVSHVVFQHFHQRYVPHWDKIALLNCPCVIIYMNVKK